MGDGLMTIETLGEAVRRALDGEEAPANGQVRAVPDIRTIRYYTTLGLIDRPAELRGRTALYAPRHVLQLVAVKRLQAEGLSLADIQARLTGLPDSKLRRLARVDVSALSEVAPASAPPSPPGAVVASAPDAPREDFWRAVPAETARAPEPLEPEPPPQAVRLGPGVLLVVEHHRALGDDDRRRLTALAAPLIEALEHLAALRGEEEE
jgi:DNA-binding transcriptional MerR regulator